MGPLTDRARSLLVRVRELPMSPEDIGRLRHEMLVLATLVLALAAEVDVLVAEHAHGRKG